MPDSQTDWRKLHSDNVANLDRQKAFAAAQFLRSWFPFDVAAAITNEASIDPEWWVKHHHGGMMACRNALRTAGFGEKDFGIDNLDDYAVGLVEVALGIVPLP